MLQEIYFAVILFGLRLLFPAASALHRGFAARLKQHNMVAEIRTMERRVARHFIFENGKIVSRRGCHANPDVPYIAVSRRG
jgi:hypothetical protein